MIKKRNFKKETLQLLLSFCIIVTVTIGGISIYSQYNTRLGIIEHNQRQVLKQVEFETNKFLNDISTMGKYIKNNYFRNKKLLKNIVDINNNISSILILDNYGLIEDFYALENINIYKGFDYSNKKYFTQIKDKNLEEYWSSVFLSTVDEEPSLSYSFKVRDKVAVIMIKLSELSDFIKRFKNSDSTHMIRLFDSSGITILNPDNPSQFLQRFNANTLSVFTNLINIEKPYSYAIFNSMLNNKKNYGTYTSIEETNWKIVIRESFDDILTTQKNIIISIIVSILFFIALSVFISLKISKKVFNELDNLQKSTANIANGNYEANPVQTHYEEFDNLLKSFNKMQMQIDKREDNLEASLSSFKMLFNSTMEVIIIHDKGNVIDLNDVAIEFLGLKNKDELIGKSLLSFIAPKDRMLLKSNFDKNTLPYEFDIVKKDGTISSCLGRGQFIKLSDKIVKLSTLIDITELKQKDRLLFQQSKMASMGEMLGNIAHQWRQPLSVISTCASGIKFQKQYDEISDEQLYESLDNIVESASYLSKTIDDFRNFFKKDKQIERFNVSKSIDSALQLLRANLKNNDIDIQTSFDDTLVIEGYPNEFLQVLINIINNAKDAIVINNIKNRIIKIRNFSVGDNICVIEIEDCAGGIPEEIIHSIFDPYFTTKHKSKGTGIGLYMAHQIITNNMKGELIAKNTTMKINENLYDGCTFIIEIPFIRDSKTETIVDYTI